MKQQFLKAKTGTIRLTTYDKNRPQIPSSALITLYKNDGSTVIQAQASATIDGTTGEMTYSLTAVHTVDRGLNFKAVWEFVVSGVTYYETQLFDVVNSILSIPITDEDLFGELPSLKKSNYQQTGTATAGAASSLTDTVRRKESDDYWKGGVLEIMSGTGSGQARDITGNVQSTGIISVSPAWATNPDSTSVYRVVKSFTATIDNCFEKIEQMLYNKGKRDALIMEASQIKVPLVYLVIHAIATDLFEEQNDRWDLIRQDYEKKFETAFSTLAIDYDENESGGVQGDEAQQFTSSIRIQRS
jgi:hypothetical protein